MMKKMFLVLISFLAIALLVIGCAPQEKELSSEEQQALDSELNQMSDEQLDQVIETTGSQ